MNTNLWTEISRFDLDDPLSEYGFSTRLANENFWTIDFTQKAILEYKKFMYLAGTSDLMVSPSGIIDTVWHQHLIFTKSYKELCDIIGKDIQHVPSTHNREDRDKFLKAKERTKELYIRTFGKQPEEIWEYADMYESLELEKSAFKIRTFILVGILFAILLMAPLYFLLKPVYIRINNPAFLQGYVLLVIMTFIGLRIYNRRYLSSLVRQFKPWAFIHTLSPMELVYLKTQKLHAVIHGNINAFFERKMISVKNDDTLKSEFTGTPSNVEEFTVFEKLNGITAIHYPELLKYLAEKPVFGNVANSMDALKKYIIKSKAFGRLFYLNFAALSAILILGILRFVTGLMRDKSVDLIGFTIIILIVMVILFLWKLTTIICTDTIPNFYRKEVLSEKQSLQAREWQYFLLGTAALSASFVPMVNYVDRNLGGESDSSSCGSSCGSSCSSCGGCGGD